jgi:hypothetical protein
MHEAAQVSSILATEGATLGKEQLSIEVVSSQAGVPASSNGATAINRVWGAR